MITICLHCIRSHCIDTKRNMSHSIVFPHRDDLDQSWTGGDKQQRDALRSCAMCQYHQPGNINLFIWSNRSSNRYCFPSVKNRASLSICHALLQHSASVRDKRIIIIRTWASRIGDSCSDFWIIHQVISTLITSYLSLKLQWSSTISYDLSIVLFVTDRTTVGTWQ